MPTVCSFATLGGSGRRMALWIMSGCGGEDKMANEPGSLQRFAIGVRSGYAKALSYGSCDQCRGCDWSLGKSDRQRVLHETAGLAIPSLTAAELRTC